MFWLESKGKSVNPLTYYKCIYIASQLTQPRLNSTIWWRNFHLLEILHISTSFAFSKPPHSSQLRALQCDTSVVCASLRVHLRIHLSCMSSAFRKPLHTFQSWYLSFVTSAFISVVWALHSVNLSCARFNDTSVVCASLRVHSVPTTGHRPGICHQQFMYVSFW